MNPALHLISRKIDDIQVGLLGFSNKGKLKTMKARATEKYIYENLKQPMAS